MMKALFSSLIEQPQNMYFDGEDSDEKIHYIFRRSFITNFDWIIVAALLFITPFATSAIFAFAAPETKGIITPKLALVLTLFWFLFTVGYIFQNFINWFFNIYIITNKRILDLDFVGLLYKNISEAPLTSVEDVTSTVSGTLRVIFNYGTVSIQTAAERREFEFTDVSKPAIVRDIISDTVTNLRNQK